jgi:CRP-like cAMP-binding protein
MELIKKYFDKLQVQNTHDWNFFRSKLECINYPSRTVILKKGQVEQYLSFIEKGIVRFYIPQEDRELTFSFSFANNFVSAYDSFLSAMPSLYQVETLTESTLWRINITDLQEVYEQTDAGNIIGRKAAEGLFLKKSQREMSLLYDNAETRYLKLLTEQPHLIQQIPLKYLASYIGITPQALSRIRKRIS